jgi:Flp pilus assembly protein TadG
MASRVLRRVADFLWGRRADVAPLVALMLVPAIGALGLGGEVSSWFMINRAMQNAADSAALAAATNADATNDSGAVPMPRYEREALAVTSSYGFTNGANNVVVTATNTAACPDGSGNKCYQVTINQPVQIYLVGITGYRGDTTINGQPAKTINASAIARPPVIPLAFCLFSTATGNQNGIRSNGGSKVDLTGCNVMSNSNARCNGSNLLATFGVAVGSSNCGVTPLPNQPVLADPYSLLAANIPANPCSPANSTTTYPQESGVLPASNLLTGSLTWPASKIFCGDVKLTGNVNLTTASPGTVMVIENGRLDLNGFTLATLPGSALTIIFTGPTISGLSPSHFPTGGGDLNINGPTSGQWSGVTIYQDPNLPSGAGIDISYAGNSPTWNLTGLVFISNANITLSGAVGKSGNGYNCFVLVDYTLLINGTGSVFANPLSECRSAGLTPPTGSDAVRTGLVG